MTSKLTVGGLFSGVGGIELAFKKAGFDISWANDIDIYAHKTYQSIMGSDHYVGNTPLSIEQLLTPKYRDQITQVDVLVGGFPCQAFSIAGYRKGFDDERGNLFFSIIDLLKHLKKTSELPKALLLENVKNFKTHDNNNTYNEVKKQLGKLGYSVYTKILNTKDYTNIPQNRERTFIVCFRGESMWNDFSIDELSDFSSDFESIYYNKTILENCESTVGFDRSFRNLSYGEKTLPIHSFLDLKEKDPIFYYSKGKYYDMLADIKTNKDTFYQIRRVYVRENKSNVCPTLTANMGTGGHNVPIFKVSDGVFRKLTPKECFNLQGYGNISLPKDMANSHLYKQAGNSVTVPLIRKIAEIIRVNLESKKTKRTSLDNVLQ